MGLFKDIVVGVASCGGPLVGGAVDGIWTGIETHSFTKGLEAGAVTAVASLVPGIGPVGRLLGRAASPLVSRLGSSLGARVAPGLLNAVGQQLAGRAGTGLLGQAARAVAGRATPLLGRFAAAGGRWLGQAAGSAAGPGVGRALGRGIAGGLASHFFNPGGADSGGSNQAIVSLPVRYAGADMKNNYFGKDPKASGEKAVFEYNSDGQAQQPYKVSA